MAQAGRIDQGAEGDEDKVEGSGPTFDEGEGGEEQKSDEENRSKRRP